MKNFLFFICIICFTTNSIVAQENNPPTSDAHGLTIEYNLFEDIVTYKKNNQIVLKPTIGKNENIYIKVIEFNPYINKAIVKVNQVNYNQSSSTFTADTYQGSESGVSGFAGIGSLLGGLSLGADTFSDYEDIPGSRGIAAQDIMKVKSEFKSLSKQLKDVESRLNSSTEKLQLFQKSENSKEIVLNDISDLKNNPNIRPSRVKEMIEEEIRYSFAKRKGEKISLDDVIDEGKKKNDLEKTIKEFKVASKDYKSITTQWLAYSMGLKLINSDLQDDQLSYIYTTTDSIVSALNKNTAEMQNIDLEAPLTNYDPSENRKTMSTLRKVYEELQSNNFTHTFTPIQAEGDEVVIEIDFLQKNALNEFEQTKTLKQRIAVSGGWNISGGMGLAFGKFNNPTHKYSVVNNTIIQDENDQFIPVVVSFAHFYRRTLSSINIGGSFGVGLPIFGGNSVQSASYFLGPTLIIGEKQRILITGGVMGAKVSRLSGGFQHGDSFDSFSDILPMTEKYEMGYFLGVSYNVIQ